MAQRCGEAAIGQLVAVLIHKHRAGIVPVIPGPRLFRHFRRALRESH
jgi:hypothetical protein